MTAALLAILQLVSLAHEGFASASSRAGVTIYRRDAHDAIAMGAEGQISSSLRSIVAVLTDYDDQPRWVKGLAESRVLARGDGWVDVYQRLKLPVVSDRDFTLHVTWRMENDVLVLRFATANERGPAPQHGLVRVTVNRGSWRLQANDAGTWAVYELTFDPAGSVPAWMGRGRAGDEVLGLFQSIRAEASHRTQ